jgi:hypothetical protein
MAYCGTQNTDYAACLKMQYISLLPKHINMYFRGAFLHVFKYAHTGRLKAVILLLSTSSVMDSFTRIISTNSKIMHNRTYNAAKIHFEDWVNNHHRENL